MRRRAAAIAAVAGLTGLAASGCGFGGIYNTPLPGGADLGSHPITISANFHDALDLIPQSAVKVDDVAVGRVARISLNPDGRTAHVVLKVNGDVRLPVGTTARLQQTSLLGEKYVALIRPGDESGDAQNSEDGTNLPTAHEGGADDAVPEGGDHGAQLKSGAVLGLNQTSDSAQVEQVLGALSLVLNGGDIGQFQEISRELQHISTGRPARIKAFLTQLNGFVSGLDQRKEAITTALDSLAGLSTRLDGDKAKIAVALDGLSPGLKTLSQQRPRFVAMLRALDRLSAVTVATLHKSQRATIDDLKALDPILAQLAKAGSDLPNSLQILLTYPFPDSVLAAIKGDYMNVFLTTNFRTLPTDCTAAACDWPQVTGSEAGN